MVLETINLSKILNGGMRAYEIVSFEELIKPIFLSDMRELGVNAPQGFAYIAKYPKLKHLLEKSVKFSYY